jgi:hypothetical protein
VGNEGFVCNHHFLTPKNGTIYSFLPGDYVVEIYSYLVGSKSVLLLSTINLSVSPEHADALAKKHAGLFFDWDPDSQQYQAHLDIRPVPKK